MQCYICAKSINQPSKCILCEKYVCQEHSRSFEVGSEKSDGIERKIHAYVCDLCMEAVEELKKKPREKWTEEDKVKSKGMIGKILRELGKAGITIIAAIFSFALWLFMKKEEESSELTQASGIESEENPEEFSNESTEEASFAEESTFKEDENSSTTQ